MELSEINPHFFKGPPWCSVATAHAAPAVLMGIDEHKKSMLPGYF